MVKLLSCLFLDKALFPFLSHVCKCLCFVQNWSPYMDKSSSYSIKCVFDGYSHTQKVYRCYNLVSRKYYTFTDITILNLLLAFLHYHIGLLSTFHMPLLIPSARSEKVPQPTTPLQVLAVQNYLLQSCAFFILLPLLVLYIPHYPQILVLLFLFILLLSKKINTIPHSISHFVS